MKKLLFLIAISLFFNSSSCETECKDCLNAHLFLVSINETDLIGVADFPFQSIINVESSQEVWNFNAYIGENIDTISLRSLQSISLPLHPDKEQSTFDFNDGNNKIVETIVFKVDFMIDSDSDSCNDFALVPKTSPSIVSQLNALDIRIDTSRKYSYICLPILELHF